jgi:hypothetical protein
MAGRFESFTKIFLGLEFLRRRHFGGLTAVADILEAKRKLREGEMIGEGRQECFTRQ